MAHVVILFLFLELTADGRVAAALVFGTSGVEGGRVRNLGAVRIKCVPVVGSVRQFGGSFGAVRGSVLHRELEIGRPGGGSRRSVEDGEVVSVFPLRGQDTVDGTGSGVAQDDLDLPAGAGEVGFLLTAREGKGGESQTRKE